MKISVLKLFDNKSNILKLTFKWIISFDGDVMGLFWGTDVEIIALEYDSIIMIGVFSSGTDGGSDPAGSSS